MKLAPIYWIIGGSLCVGGILIAIIGAALGAAVPSAGIKTSSFTKTFDEADSLDLDLNACELNIITSEDAKVFTVDVKNVAGSPEATFSNGTLIVKNTSPKISFGSFPDGSVTITAPAQTFKAVDIDLDAANGGTVSGLTTDKLSIDIDAGKITFKNVTAETTKTSIDLDAVDVEIRDCSFSDTDIDLDAGKATIIGTTFDGTARFSNDAGKFDLNSCKIKNGNVNSNAGSFKASALTLSGNMNCKANACKVDLQLLGDKNAFSVVSNSDASSVKIDGQKGSMVNNGADQLITLDGSAASFNVSFIKE